MVSQFNDVIIALYSMRCCIVADPGLACGERPSKCGGAGCGHMNEEMWRFYLHGMRCFTLSDVRFFFVVVDVIEILISLPPYPQEGKMFLTFFTPLLMGEMILSFFFFVSGPAVFLFLGGTPERFHGILDTIPVGRLIDLLVYIYIYV